MANGGEARAAVAGVLVLALAGACDKSSAGPADGGAGETTSTTAPTSPTTPTTIAPTGGTTSAAVAAASWSGTYKSVPHGFYLPTDAPNGKDWKDLRFQGDDASAGLGEGALALTVDATGGVHGTVDGPIGPAIITGNLDGAALTAQVTRKDPADKGLSGTMEGKLAGDQIAGTMRLSAADANIIRSAAFTLAKK